jgi:hypothetical protein
MQPLPQEIFQLEKRSCLSFALRVGYVARGKEISRINAGSLA